MGIFDEEGSATEEYFWLFYFVDVIDFDFNADKDDYLTLLM